MWASSYVLVGMDQESAITISIKIFLIAIPVLLIHGCSDQQDRESVVNEVISVKYLQQDARRYTRGLNLFQSNCAACHGRQAEGASGWPARDSQGMHRAPPLNDAGRTWHHPMRNLLDVIHNGTVDLGGGMPAWSSQLSVTEIRDIIFWIQSQWTREQFESWYRLNHEVELSREEFESSRQ